MARKYLLVLDGALEEALAGLARERAVVEAADLVAANRTRARCIVGTLAGIIIIRVIQGR